MPETEYPTPNRLALGIAAGAAVPIIALAMLFGPLWKFAVAVGILWTALLVPTFLMPAYRCLRSRGMLTILWAIFLGGVTSALPSMLLAIGDLMSGKTSGLVRSFVFEPLFLFFPLGAIGGLLAWLIAVGWRFKI